MNEDINPKSSGPHSEVFQMRAFCHGRKACAYLSAENKVVYDHSQADWFETAADAYRRIKLLPKGMGVFVVEKVIEYLDCAPPPGPCPELIKNVLDEIPLPYSLTAAAWYEGVDVRREPVVFGPLPRSTHYRHRRNLLEHGIDIGKPCNIRILRLRWDQIHQREATLPV